MDLILVAFPIAGLLTGSIADYGFISGKLAIRSLWVSLSLFIFSCVTDVSFSFEALDWITLAIGLFAMGYGGSSQFKNGDAGIHRNIFFTLRAATIIFYCSLPFVYAAQFFMAFTNNWVGQTVHVEKARGYKIKHVRKNSHFTFPGYHLAEVYKSFLLIEYPVDHFNLGTYGAYGFDSYLIEDDGGMTLLNKFEYDPERKLLVLYRYQGNKYLKDEEIDHSQ
jgi:hypothetical protein